MLNFANLSSYEFELVCRDIAQRKANIKLSCYTAGRDGGIDASDCFEGNKNNHRVIVQAKHFVRSNFAHLKNEASKFSTQIENLHPHEIYFMTSLGLTPANIACLHDVLKNCANHIEVFGQQDIDDFLTQASNKDILRRHFKLWLTSTNILESQLNQSTFFDCDEILFDIREGKDFYIKTSAFDEAKEKLEEVGVIMLTGDPGVGKSTISKMLLLDYAEQGYRIIYSTDGDTSRIKNALSNDPNVKEIVLLDDFLGQTYWNSSEQKPSELKTLVSHFIHRNGKRLILNTRISIYNEVRRKSQTFDSIATKCAEGHYVIDMNKTSDVEKAMILYSHLANSKVPQPHLNSILENENYF